MRDFSKLVNEPLKKRLELVRAGNRDRNFIPIGQYDLVLDGSMEFLTEPCVSDPPCRYCQAGVVARVHGVRIDGTDYVLAVPYCRGTFMHTIHGMLSDFGDIIGEKIVNKDDENTVVELLEVAGLLPEPVRHLNWFSSDLTKAIEPFIDTGKLIRMKSAYGGHLHETTIHTKDGIRRLIRESRSLTRLRSKPLKVLGRWLYSSSDVVWGTLYQDNPTTVTCAVCSYKALTGGKNDYTGFHDASHLLGGLSVLCDGCIKRVMAIIRAYCGDKYPPPEYILLKLLEGDIKRKRSSLRLTAKILGYV